MYMLLIWLAVVSLLTVALGESWTWWMSTVLFYLLNIHTKTDATGKNWWTLDMSQLMTKTLSGMGFFHHLTEICQFGSSKVQGLFWRYVQIRRYTLFRLFYIEVVFSLSVRLLILVPKQYALTQYACKLSLIELHANSTLCIEFKRM